MFLVIACPRCRRAKVVEPGKKTTTCGSCDRELVLGDLRVFHQGATLEEAQEASGRLNARLAGREREFAAAFLPSGAPRPARHDDPYDAAAAAARKADSEKDRADAVARSLGASLREFSEDDLQRAFERAGIGRAGWHLERMLKTDVVFEPRPGRYQAL